MYSASEKPTYNMADEKSLVLWDCRFNSLELTAETYVDKKNNISRLFYQQLKKSWTNNCLSRAFYDQYLNCIYGSPSEDEKSTMCYNEGLTSALNHSNYTPIRKRKRKC